MTRMMEIGGRVYDGLSHRLEVGMGTTRHDGDRSGLAACGSASTYRPRRILRGAGTRPIPEPAHYSPSF